ncbi:Hypothetical protein CINCED_3A006205 [Cinara cedri]|uniref:Uncharacterized protein n=1 Tax=Cinara cedri TaxID=506608 RepID=A0A5E4MJ67_9HEMI|nr:Hypothetical protein CINCED_3A006205 [Cinara cedri]
MHRIKAENNSGLEWNKTYTYGSTHKCEKPSYRLNLLSKSLDTENIKMKHESRNSPHCNKHSRNCIKSKQTNSSRSIMNNQSSASNPYKTSLNDSSNYDWTLSNDELSMDQIDVPIYDNTPKISRYQYDRPYSYRDSRNDYLPYVRSTNRNSIKDKNIRNDGRHHTNGEQGSCHKQPNVSSHLNRSRNEGYRNNSNKSNITSEHQNTRPRRNSTSNNYSNKVCTNCNAKRQKPQCENKNNNSCPTYIEPKKNKTRMQECNNKPNRNMNNLAMPKLNCKRNDSRFISRYCDNSNNWDIDVDNYSKFLKNFTSQDQSIPRRSSLKNTPNFHYQSSSTELYESDNSSDWSNEIPMDHLPAASFNSYNSSNSPSTLTALGSRYNPIPRQSTLNDDRLITSSQNYQDIEKFNLPYLNTNEYSRNSIGNYDLTNKEIPQQSALNDDWPTTSDQNYQDIDEFNLPYISIDNYSRNHIENTGSPHAIYQQQQLRDWSFRESDIENTSMSELSYDTTFSNTSESMDNVCYDHVRSNYRSNLKN